MRSAPLLSYLAVFINLVNRANKQVRFHVLLMLIALMAGAAAASVSTASFRALLFLARGDSELVGASTLLSAENQEAPAIFPAPIGPIPLNTHLNNARRGHTATLLTDGKVLITGGEDASEFVTEAEIYDPALGSFSVSGNLSTPRADHSATRLNDGRVLIAGGRGELGALSSTEIFDPATAAFTAGPNLIGARSGHSATSLSDGRIVIVGGDASGSIEIYVPLLDAFAPGAANLSSPRAFHSAAVLKDGNILVVGGTAPDSSPVLSGEIFNVTSSTFSSVGNQTQDAHIRALLRVLPDGKVQIIGGTDHEDMEVYDPAINSFGAHAHVFPIGDSHPALLQEILDSPARAALFHFGASSTLLDRTGQTITEIPGSNQALVTGGVDSSGAFLSSASTLNSSAATVTTDKLDYAPGTPVIVSGTGWQPNEVVTLTFHEDPHVGTENPHTFTVQADANGNFANQQYAPEELDNGLTYILAAKGEASGWTAQTAFTDASPGSLGNYATAGLSGTSAPATVSPSNVATNVTFTTLARGAGLSATATSDAFNSSSWPLASTLTIAGNTDYYEFTITPNSGYKFSNSELRVGLQRSGSGPDKAELRSSLDSYGSAIGSVLSVGTGLATFTINLSSVLGLQNRTSAVTFRVYGYGATAVGGTLRIQRVISPAMVGLEVDGTVAPLSSGTLQFSAANYPDAETNSGTHTKTITVQRTGGLDGAVSVHYATSDGTATTADNDYDTTSGDLNWADGDTADKTFTVTVHGDATYEENETVNLTLSAPTGGAIISGTNPATLTITNDDSAPSYATADNASATYGQTSVTLSAMVSPNPGGGSVEFFIDGSSVGTGAVGSGGVATFNYNPSGLNAGSYAIRADFGGFAAYSATSSNPATNGTLTINKAIVEPHITADNKTYDAAIAAAIATRTLTGVIGGDDVSLTGGSATFDTKDVGTNKTVTGTGLILTGTTAGNYQLSSTSATTTADITPATLTPAIVVNDKVYDGTAGATLSSQTVSPVLGTDNVTLVVGTANFSDKNVGTGKTVTATGLTLSGADSGNYELSSTSATDLADITTLHITGSFTAANKVYDGNNSATVLSRSLSGTAGGDDVILTGGTATFDDANAGNGRTVTLSGATLAGADAGNYVLDSVSTTAADIAKADATIVVTPYHVTYDAHAHTATGTATGVQGESLAGLDLSITTHTDAGDYPTDTWTFTDATGNYNDAGGTIGDEITKANSTTVVTCPASETYTGSAIEPCTASYSGAGGLSGTLTPTYLNNVNVGTASASATYAGDANHEGSSDSKTFEITQASSTTTIDCSPGSFTYTGSAITPCTATVTRVGDANTTAPVVYANNTNVGTATADASYAGDSNHTGSTATQVTFEITQASSTTTIDCSPGSFTYTGSAITPCTATVTRVGDANTTTAVTYANNTNVGTATADATYAGDANHTGSTATQVSFEITQASSTTTIDCSPGSFTYTGSPITPCTATVTRVGDANTTATMVYANNTNVGTATADATYAGDANHTGSTASQVTFAITQASSTTTIDCSPGSFTYTGSAITSCTATVTRVGDANTTTAVTYANNTNVGTATADASYAGDANHTGSTATQVTFAITAANTTTIIANAASLASTPTLVGQSYTVNWSVSVNSPGAGMPTGTVTVSGGSGCSAPVAAGGCTVTSTTAGAKTLVATYTSDSANFNGSVSAGASHTVNAASTTTTITSDNPDPSVSGGTVTVTYTVAVNAPGSGTATGTVTVTDADSAATCNSSVATGQCSLALVNPGTHHLTATYVSNTADFTGSASAVENHTVTPVVIAAQIAFSSNRDGNFEIYKMAADGSGVVRLTNNSAADGDPSWSPDKTKIAFTSTRHGNFEIYVMNADGSSVMRLTTNSAFDFFPAWSPDGSKIAFTSNRSGNFEVYLMNSNGTGALTRLTTNWVVDGAPAWSPDGSKIAFTSRRDGNYEIYVMNSNGSGLTRLTNNGAIDGLPSWSPDGLSIAFNSTRDGNLEIYTMAANGSGQTRRTTNSAADGEPSWGANGKIAFSSTRNGNLEIYTMNADGTLVTRLTSNSAWDLSPHW